MPLSTSDSFRLYFMRPRVGGQQTTLGVDRALTDELLNIEQKHFFTVVAEGMGKQCLASVVLAAVISEK